MRQMIRRAKKIIKANLGVVELLIKLNGLYSKTDTGE
jgi:hypothetical protein